jgi:hypothetical protein
MTILQEDALYEFLENVSDAFSINEIVLFIRLIDSSGRTKRLAEEVAAFMSARNLAFHLEKNLYVSRRGCFESARFVINPSRMEIMNGILIPGHRCIPFANPAVLPHEYSFVWQGNPIPETNMEGAPEELYPYYMLFGEEYAPQYVAHENAENEEAFSDCFYDDPPEVSIKTLDMSAIFMASGFVPGDVFSVKTLDWRKAVFELERVAANSWSKCELYAWAEEAEAAFKEVFSRHGACHSVEEQISYAYWYGGKRMRETPAYALDDFLYNQTEQIETVPYGIETRFWFAGKEIPDLEDLRTNQGPPDRTPIEEILYNYGVPISEYVIQSYVRDALFRGEMNIENIIDCIVPPSICIQHDHRKHIANYIDEVYAEFAKTYSIFTDKSMGPIRKRICELHTAVIDQAAQITKIGIDQSWFPKHLFVIFAQIQSHAAGILEDLDTDEAPSEPDLEAMDNSSDSMLETYDEMKDLIELSIESFRRYKISVVRGPETVSSSGKWLTLQASLGGTDVWRRFTIPSSANLADLHKALQILFDWKNSFPYHFIIDEKLQKAMPNTPLFPLSITLESLHTTGKMDFVYEYGNYWTITLLFLPNDDVIPGQKNYCIEGARIAPPEHIEGPLQFRRNANFLKKGLKYDKKCAFDVYRQTFNQDQFDIEDTNKKLSILYEKIKQDTDVIRNFSNGK